MPSYTLLKSLLASLSKYPRMKLHWSKNMVTSCREGWQKEGPHMSRPVTMTLLDDTLLRMPAQRASRQLHLLFTCQKVSLLFETFMWNTISAFRRYTLLRSRKPTFVLPARLCVPISERLRWGP
ncbi:hypothetical protein WG66_002438 [Moniliophthora roreri]|nr:hypothetical protein WG66_002438 [Moniliophthora roreri]